MRKARTEILNVPQEKATRESLRQLAREVVHRENLRPPVHFDILSEISDEIIGISGCDAAYHGFIIVLVSNEIWRPSVAATPFHRRLLLLPQCLKNNQKCQGKFDDIGLICNGCKSCSLDYLIGRAEQFGYATLIAEGTSMAVRLENEGSVDAIIGVSCMSVLERSYDSVERSAVPVIGIPLLFDGCSDTVIDENWLTEELGSFIPDPLLQPLSVSLLKEKVKLFFTEDRLRRLFRNQGDHTMEAALRSMLFGGQRIRPLLTALAYTAYSFSDDDDLLEQLSIIVECFHKASLIHDDIEDNDDTRYDSETLHKKEGVEVAINAGDYLTGKGYELLSALTLPLQKRAECLSLVASAHVTLTLGQGADLLARREKKLPSTDDLLKTYSQKTGAAIEVALLLGAISAGAGPAEQQLLREFSRLFGIAYQVRDDLEEFQTNKPVSAWHDFPFLIALLKEQLNGSSGRFFLPELRYDELKEHIVKHGVEDKVAFIIGSYADQAYSVLGKLQNNPLKLSLFGVMGKIFKDYERP
jgi:geranylgeranyl pyrophosphate synthase